MLKGLIGVTATAKGPRAVYVRGDKTTYPGWPAVKAVYRHERACAKSAPDGSFDREHQLALNFAVVARLAREERRRRNGLKLRQG